MKLSSRDFPSTHWSVVRVIQHGDGVEAEAAMESICRGYWYPIYAYLRQSGYPPADAEDLTQGVFHRVIGGNALLTAAPERGRLRSYLLGVMKRHLRDQGRDARRLKRGGGQIRIPIDEVAEQRYQQTEEEEQSPDMLFDQAWAQSVLTAASEKLRELFREGDNEGAFEHLCEFLPLGENATPYSKVAERMGNSEGAVRLQVHRMRRRYRDLIVDHVAETVRNPADVQDELDYLMTLAGDFRAG